MILCYFIKENMTNMNIFRSDVMVMVVMILVILEDDVVMMVMILGVIGLLLMPLGVLPVSGKGPHLSQITIRIMVRRVLIRADV